MGMKPRKGVLIARVCGQPVYSNELPKRTQMFVLGEHWDKESPKERYERVWAALRGCDEP